MSHKGEPKMRQSTEAAVTQIVNIRANNPEVSVDENMPEIIHAKEKGKVKR